MTADGRKEWAALHLPLKDPHEVGIEEGQTVSQSRPTVLAGRRAREWVVRV